MLELYDEIGFKIDHFFSNLMESSYENGPIYLTGRDLVVFVAGGLSMFVIILAIIGIKETIRRKNK